MQNAKERIVSYELARRISPRAYPKPKTTGMEPHSPAPSAPARKTPKDNTKKAPNHPARSRASEKKRPSRISELESQVSRLQEELKRAKDQLTSFQRVTNLEESPKKLPEQRPSYEETQEPGLGQPKEAEADTNPRLSQREEELEAELKKRISEIEDLKADLMDRETELQCVLSENDSLQAKLEKNNHPVLKEIELENELKRLKEAVTGLKAKLMDKETELQNISEENETLRLELCKMKGYTVKNSRIRNEKSGPLDFPYDAFCGKLGSCRVEDLGDDLTRKKAGKKFGVLWKKYKK